MTKTVVILGGSFAGCQVAHRLLKQTLPHVPDLKVILVSKNSHFFWNFASVRAIIPDALPTADLFLPLADGFAKYPAASFELVIGAATGSDFTAKTVTVTIPGNAEPRTIAYDQLVLATGSRAAAIGPDGKTPLPFKAWGTHEEAAAALDALRERVSAARHVVVAGAGGTGVELAAELGFAFSQPKVKPEARKEVVLLSAGDTLLNGDYLAGPAETELKKLGVQIKKGATVTGTTVKEGGKTAVALSNGETIETDLYLPTFGLIPNSEFVDAKYKRDGGYLVVDEFLRVKDAGDVWAAGDLVSLPRAGYLITEKQAHEVWRNLNLVLTGKQPTPAKKLPFDVLVVATGRSRGLIRINSVRLPSIIAWFGKARNLAMQMFPGYVNGSQW